MLRGTNPGDSLISGFRGRITEDELSLYGINQ